LPEAKSVIKIHHYL